jgi:hypothetical protein
MNDSRYPYTYACDMIRRLGPVARDGVVLSRSDVSHIRQGIAEALGMDDHELACKLADAQLQHENDPVAVQTDVNRLLVALGRRPVVFENTTAGGSDD